MPVFAASVSWKMSFFMSGASGDKRAYPGWIRRKKQLARLAQNAWKIAPRASCATAACSLHTLLQPSPVIPAAVPAASWLVARALWAEKIQEAGC
jgi:hypothetical protein